MKENIWSVSGILLHCGSCFVCISPWTLHPHFLLWDLAFLSFKHYQQACRRWLGLPSVISLHSLPLPNTHLNSISVSPFNIPAHSEKSTLCHHLHSTLAVSSYESLFDSWFMFALVFLLGLSVFCHLTKFVSFLSITGVRRATTAYDVTNLFPRLTPSCPIQVRCRLSFNPLLEDQH